MSVFLIDDIESLTALADSWKNIKHLAIDTEFERRTTFYAKLALVQIFDGESIYLIDPLKTKCPENLKNILNNAEVVKILHSSKEDLEVLYTAWDCQVNNLFDTQVAYSFLHQELSIGYAKLVEGMTGQFISKQQTTSDWIKRPLSQEQLNYASKDVLYLLEIYQQLNETIKTKAYYQNFINECLEYCQSCEVKVNSKSDYRDAKDVWQLNAKDLSLFKELYYWREEKAKADNRTKNHIIKDQELVQLVIKKPSTVTQLKTLLELHPRSIRLYSQKWLDIIDHWQKSEPEYLQAIPNPRDVDGLKSLSTKFELVVKTIAKEQDLSPTFLLSKRLIRKLAFSFLTESQVPMQWQGWRKVILNESITSCFNQFKNKE